MDKIRQARDAFVAAEAAFTQGYAQHKNRELDLALAQREGEGIEKAEARLKDVTREVFGSNGLFDSRNKAALALCDALEIDPKLLKAAL